MCWPSLDHILTLHRPPPSPTFFTVRPRSRRHPLAAATNSGRPRRSSLQQPPTPPIRRPPGLLWPLPAARACSATATVIPRACSHTAPGPASTALRPPFARRATRAVLLPCTHAVRCVVPPSTAAAAVAARHICRRRAGTSQSAHACSKQSVRWAAGRRAAGARSRSSLTTCRSPGHPPEGRAGSGCGGGGAPPPHCDPSIAHSHLDPAAGPCSGRAPAAPHTQGARVVANDGKTSLQHAWAEYFPATPHFFARWMGENTVPAYERRHITGTTAGPRAKKRPDRLEKSASPGDCMTCAEDPGSGGRPGATLAGASGHHADVGLKCRGGRNVPNVTYHNRPYQRRKSCFLMPDGVIS